MFGVLFMPVLEGFFRYHMDSGPRIMISSLSPLHSDISPSMRRAAGEFMFATNIQPFVIP